MMAKTTAQSIPHFELPPDSFTFRISARVKRTSSLPLNWEVPRRGGEVPFDLTMQSPCHSCCFVDAHSCQLIFFVQRIPKRSATREARVFFGVPDPDAHLRQAAADLPEQIEHLRAKGLLIPDEPQALTVLRRVGPSRFKGYLLPYKTVQGYQPGLAFGDIERLMRLDDALRLHVLGAMQIVKVGVRQAMVQCLLERHGLRWYADAALFSDSTYFNHASFLTSFTTEFHALPELFVGHYRERYDQGALRLCIPRHSFITASATHTRSG
jgi:Abi-like protein